MTEKIKINDPIIVEGKYDRLRILSVAEANVITTDGFGIFKKSEKLSLLRALAERSPVIVLTDSDGAGKLIRSHISSAIPKDKLIQLYIPQIEGKEKRKSEPSAEGTLGVEGIDREIIYKILLPYADEGAYARALEHPLSKADLYEDGLCGKDDSAERRDELCASIGLPKKMTPNALLAALKMIYTYEEYLSLVGRKEK